MFLTENIASSEYISNWKGQDIINFQEDLIRKVNSSISEKWFYNYLKTKEPKKLPRIDMLNLLSRYVGEKDWLSFKHKIAFEQKQSDSESKKEDSDKDKPKIQPKRSTTPFESQERSNAQVKSTEIFKRYWIWGLLVSFVLGTFIGLTSYIELPFFQKENSFTFCFIDADRNLPVQNLEFTVLKTGESPIYFSSDEDGCFKWRTSDSILKLVVRSPYYKRDTIYRMIKNKRYKRYRESVELTPDDYALMVQYFSTSNTEDWKKRRQELNRIISEKALIYQIFMNEQFGIEIYTKEEFINKLTLPTSSLKNLQIIDKPIKNERGQIVQLKFEVKAKKNE